jgi:hypothetical protein
VTIDHDPEDCSKKDECYYIFQVYNPSDSSTSPVQIEFKLSYEAIDWNNIDIYADETREIKMGETQAFSLKAQDSSFK